LSRATGIIDMIHGLQYIRSFLYGANAGGALTTVNIQPLQIAMMAHVEESAPRSGLAPGGMVTGALRAGGQGH
jgi:hypothetical protein